MRKYLFNYRSLIYFLGIGFFILAAEFIFSFNLWPEHIVADHPISSVVKHYSVVLPHHLEAEKLLVNWHIVGGLLLLVFGLLQMSHDFHFKFPKLHRIFGFAYLGTGSMAAVLGIKLSTNVLGGLLASVVFWVIGSLWFWSAGKSIFYVWARQFQLHHRWAARNYFLTVATGLARPAYVIVDHWLPGVGPEVLFPLSNWLALVAALLLSQWYVEKSERPKTNLKKVAIPIADEKMAG